MLAKAPLLRLSLLPALITTMMIAADVSSALSPGQPVDYPKLSQLLQFTSGGHVLGFQRSCVYVAAGNHMLRESFVGTKGAAPQADRPPAKDDRARPLGKVSYPELWPGITLVYDRPPGGIVRSTYHVAPGADPNLIGLRYNVPVHLDGGGNLVFEFAAGTMTACAPVAWQAIDEKRLPVDVAFYIESSDSNVRFLLGAYDPALPVFIDPTLSWNTFIGSSGHDGGNAIAVDGNGIVYVAGYSDATWGSPLNAYAGERDVFVAELNSGGVLQWHTFMGSSDGDYGYAIAVDGSGNVHVAGSSDATWGSPLNAHAGNEDAFVAKLNSSGGLQWHTFMGCSQFDSGHSLAVDSSGNVYVAGYSDATWGSPLNTHAGNEDAFVAKLNSSGGLQWHTFMGCSQFDRGFAVAVDGSGNVYGTGYSYESWGSPVNAHAGVYDAFVAKLNSSGGLQWHTFMGCSQFDSGHSLAVDSSGNVYVAGRSEATWGSPVNGYAEDSDAFAAKLNSSGVLQWNTFMGSSDYDRANAIAVDGSGNVHVAGYSNDSWGNPLNAYAGYSDAFVAKLNSSGMLQWNTFMGASGMDSGDAVAIDGSSNVYVAGGSYISWGSPVNPHVGLRDAFAAKLSSGGLNPGIPLLLLGSSDE